jgi:hypothetical protein
MTKLSFDQDVLVRKLTPYFLAGQVGAFVIVFAFVLLNLQGLALSLSCLTFAIFVAMGSWLFLRYKNHPLVREKSTLIQQVNTVQAGVRTQNAGIQSAEKKRAELTQAQQGELQRTLLALQNDYIQNGLRTNQIKDATIPGVGNALKARLNENGITSALHVSDRIASISGFGEAKQTALFAWRGSVLQLLEKSKPAKLPFDRSEIINDKYLALQDQNDRAESNARNQKQNLEHELSSLLPRLESLSSITFVSYLNKSLASRGFVSAFIALILICSQTASGFGATTSALMASIPTATASVTPSQTFTPTLTPTDTLTPTITYTSTITLTPSITYTPTNTDAPTITNTPTITFTPTRTFTPRPIRTNTHAPTSTPLPTSQLPSGGGGGGAGGYDSNGDGKVTCADFQTQAAAQQAYNAGYANLDGNDKDGKACESLP